jgi:acetyl esterase/lipase
MPVRAAMGIGLVASLVGLLAAAAAPPSPGGPATRPTAPSGPPPGIQRVKLWDKTPGVVEGNDRDVDPTEPTIDLYLPPPDKATGAAVLVLPGGGYVNLSTTREGSDIARELVGRNIAAFVVRYRHAPRYHNPLPLLDAQRAVRTVRAKAADFHVDPNRIGILGFSAGGHLAATVATMDNDGPAPETPDAIDGVSARPDFAVLMYPVINLTDDAVVHKGSRTALVGDDTSLYQKLSPELHVTKDTPPVFLCHAMDDRTVPVMNSVLFYEACLKARVPAEMHLMQNGGHGFSLGGTDPALSAWPGMMVRWMAHNKWLAPAAAR